MIAIIIRGGHYRQNFKPDVFQKALGIPLIPISEEDKNGFAFAHLQMKRWIKSSYPVESIKPVIDGYIQIWLFDYLSKNCRLRKSDEFKINFTPTISKKLFGTCQKTLHGKSFSLFLCGEDVPDTKVSGSDYL